MGRFGAKVTIFVLNNDGYMVERALKKPRLELQRPCAVEICRSSPCVGLRRLVHGACGNLGEIDAAMQKARSSKSGAYIEIVGGRMDLPPALAFARRRLSEMYGVASSRAH